jgi:putative hemolysin
MEAGMSFFRVVAAVGLALVFSGTGSQMMAQTPRAKASSSASIDQAKAYCTSTGGELELRHAVFGTNNPQQDWLWLTGVQSFCQYTLSSDGSRIHLSLPTLFSPKPTLAALAYYSQVPWNGQGNGNPASFYCTQLGGAEIGATDFSGGGWVLLGSIDESLEACVFPDNSTIDSWGLFYHSASIVRGIDLATVLKYPNPYTAKK